MQLVKFISQQTSLLITRAVPYRGRLARLQDLAGVNLAAQARAKGELRKKRKPQTTRSNVLRAWPVLLRVRDEFQTKSMQFLFVFFTQHSFIDLNISLTEVMEGARR